MTRLPAGGLAVSTADLAEAKRGFAPAASWGVTNATASDGAGPRGWEDVGGMPDVVDALREALALPMRFARLCARCVAPHSSSTAAVDALAVDIILIYALLKFSNIMSTRVHECAVQLYIPMSTHAGVHAGLSSWHPRRQEIATARVSQAEPHQFTAGNHLSI